MHKIAAKLASEENGGISNRDVHTDGDHRRPTPLKVTEISQSISHLSPFHAEDDNNSSPMFESSTQQLAARTQQQSNDPNNHRNPSPQPHPTTTPNPKADDPLISPNGKSVSSKTRWKKRMEADHAELLAKGFDVFNNNVMGVQLLRKFMNAEHSVDNYDFLLSVQTFRTRHLAKEELIRLAHHIYNYFLDSHSKHEVTFPSELRSKLLHYLNPGMASFSTHTTSTTVNSMANHTSSYNNHNNHINPVNVDYTIHEHIFDEIYDVVNNTVRTDVFRRFISGSFYKILSADLHDRYTQHQKIKDGKPLHTHHQHNHSLSHNKEVSSKKNQSTRDNGNNATAQRKVFSPVIYKSLPFRFTSTFL